EVGAEDSIRETVEREGLREEEWVVGIHAGASLEDRRWPAASFADLADRLADRWNARILLFGVRSESALAEEIMQRMQRKDRVLNLTGQTRLAQLVAWLKRCRYLVSNDTGPMHLAAALGVKIVGLFFAHAHPYETAPYVPGNLIFQARIPCAPCSYGVHCNHIVCIHKVTPEQVCSMVETHARAGKWEVPPGLGSLPEVHIFETGTDPEDLLVLRPLLRHPVTLDDVFRTGYARLWPHVLSDIPGDLDEQRLTSLVSQLRNDYDCRLLTLLLPKIQEKIGVLQKLREWAEQGIRTAEQILQIEPGTGRGISPLKQLGDTVSRVDEEIGRIACTHPEIRPLADLFAKRKENLQGEDVRALAQGSQECYAKLDRESSFLRKILERVIREFEAGADGEGQAET
ncbi:MAG: hypothetical protein GWM98_17560, partial [Nitrospinaceae bacterium]|nr:glycosyltransferase family 9 protein [Nitrospinaceae bacterium]NIR55958.1 glycosyltransferase family 9 protein [Nitrospinaceae bacterium]NIS86401.1 glycosyltransferase family 9 protein [Nitrospinaceae bacterium]NIT83239.1 glycosyltransferase family 9 protein [Nitrospinaceae bacterium]NIU45444.1 glycosyltransferase family 9 protein [Nitrospinaceae bacterium]